MQRGLLIHAYGDSYAHVDAFGNAYGWPLGHAPDGHFPDFIINDVPKYADYIRNLYEALGGTDPEGNDGLKTLLATAATLVFNPVTDNYINPYPLLSLPPDITAAQIPPGEIANSKTMRKLAEPDALIAHVRIRGSHPARMPRMPGAAVKRRRKKSPTCVSLASRLARCCVTE
jgi:hypothetical protein